MSAAGLECLRGCLQTVWSVCEGVCEGVCRHYDVRSRRQSADTMVGISQTLKTVNAYMHVHIVDFIRVKRVKRVK